MGLDIIHNLQIKETMVSNDFIDCYMTSANGEYVKVYLYLLRHGQDVKDFAEVADALNHTEADIKRAVTYWEKQGVLKRRSQLNAQKETVIDKQELQGLSVVSLKRDRTAPTSEQVEALAMDETFTQLLYIAQKYMNKIFTSRECEVFTYLYHELQMNAELLEYVVEFCVQGGHSSLRYIETVAMDWHSKGITTVDMAKKMVIHYTNDMFAVMKAFGLQDRKPGASESDLMSRWFHQYGFTKEIVLEACKRTLEAIQKPSFPYTEAILTEWHRLGVKRTSDIQELDQNREQKRSNKVKAGKGVVAKVNKNQFHNFEQRDTNYDALVLERLKERLEES